MPEPVISYAKASFQFNLKPLDSDVFAAEKYFKGDLFTQENVFTGKEAAPTVFPMSRGNSRSSLVRANSRSRRHAKNRAAAIFNCSCADHDSVDVDDDYAPDKTRRGAGAGFGKSHAWEDANSNFLPAFCPGAGDEPRRDGAAISKPLNIWSPIPEFGTISLKLDTKWGDEKMYYESDSDNSSDLFEIDFLSRGYPVYSDEFSFDKNRYLPSEGTVITASAADYSHTETNEYAKQGGMDNNSSKTRRRLLLNPNIFAGCKSEKAVGVVGSALKGRRASHRRLLPSSFRPLKVSDAGGVI